MGWGDVMSERTLLFGKYRGCRDVFVGPVMDRLAAMTPQRPLAEVANECDVVIVGEDLAAELGGLMDVVVAADPFRAGLDMARDEKKRCCVILPPHYFVVEPGPTWMQALRIYQDMQVPNRGKE